MESKDNMPNQIPDHPPPSYEQTCSNYNTVYSVPIAGSTGYNNPAFGTMSYESYQQSMVVTQQPGFSSQSVIVPDHMGLAVFVTLCCCWPLGLAAISKASESRAALARNDVHTAKMLSEESRKTSIYGMTFGGVILAISLVLTVSIIVYLRNSYNYNY